MIKDDFRMNELLRSNYPDHLSKEASNKYDIDNLIRQVLPMGKQYKTARIISDVCRASGGYFSANEVAGHLCVLKNADVLDTFGNMELWGYSEVCFKIQQKQ